MIRTLLSICIVALSAATAVAQTPTTLDVWPGKPPGETGAVPAEKIVDNKPGERKLKLVHNVTKPTITVFRPQAGKDTGAAVVICPGGGYNVLAWDLEGEEVAQWLNSLGVTGIVLKYRVPRRSGQAPHRAPLMDAQRAMSLVRSRAKDWKIDPERIGILGFSAGGHLAAATSTNFDKRTYEPIDDIDKVSSRPNFAVLVYPAYLTAKDGKLSSEIRVTKQTPPVFFAHANDDGISPENSARMYLELRRAGVPAELHIYTNGGHGFGMRVTEKSAAPTWPARCAEWLRVRAIVR